MTDDQPSERPEFRPSDGPGPHEEPAPGAPGAPGVPQQGQDVPSGGPAQPGPQGWPPPPDRPAYPVPPPPGPPPAPDVPPGQFMPQPPDVPPGPVMPPGPYGYPGEPPRPPEPPGGHGSIVLGVIITVLTLAMAFLATSVPPDSPLADLAPWVIVLSPLGLIVAGIVLALIRRTTRTGAGILLGLGASVLIAGGLCIVFLASYGG